ncbi:MAG TPA: hypothetical protein VHO70_00685 [Chitinispirillaceae bacterium]|nr:hypothetical protein [Chitinispirillaceae bacterium]
MTFNYTRTFRWIALLLTLNMQSFSSVENDTSVIGILNQVDVAVKKIKDKLNSEITSMDNLKIWCDSLLKEQPCIYSIITADSNGTVFFEQGRYQEKMITEVNVSKISWFLKTIQGKTSENVEIVKFEGKKVMLNSWVSTSMVPGTKSVAAVLTDLEMVLSYVNLMHPAPAALLYNGKIIYESNWVQDDSRIISVPEVKGLEIAVMNTDVQSLPFATLVPSMSLAHENRLFLGIAIVSLLVGIMGIILFIINQNVASKLRNDAYLKLEEEKLSNQEKEKIHNLAVSHVYCELKRQVETHELQEIESQVRHEIETSIRNKPETVDSVKMVTEETV